MGMNTNPTHLPALDDPDRLRLTGEDVLDGRDVAAMLHVPLSTVLDYARRGVLPGRKLGRRWIFLRDELEAAVRAAPSANGALDPRPGEAPTSAKTTLKRYRGTVPPALTGHRVRLPARP